MSKLLTSHRPALGALAFVLLLSTPALAASPLDSAPASFGVTDRTVALAVHGEGAQIYQCKADAEGRLVWTFREPIAALIAEDGRTVGRHFAGPTWEVDGGGAVKGQLSTSAPAATASDIPILKLTATDHRGAGALSAVTVILRLNTHGGVFKGTCAVAGDLRAEPYSADYVFLR